MWIQVQDPPFCPLRGYGRGGKVAGKEAFDEGDFRKVVLNAQDVKKQLYFSPFIDVLPFPPIWIRNVIK